MKNGKGTHIYMAIAEDIEQRIMSNVLRIGEKLPSVRSLSKMHNVSMSTSLQAYYLLEGKGLIEARPQSGYFVRFNPSRFPKKVEKSNPSLVAKPKSVAAIISEVYDDFAMKGMMRFSLSVPDPELLPLAKLNKAMIRALRELPAAGTSYESIQGNANLRREIAKTSIQWGGHLQADDIITTAGCM
ncbi:MAG TPA: GntR family transcriptional regulator, partial [Chitinophagaceae bacterium]|nr:GntR family transcriptional regulator [Chitinophagaceae bacterium]